jgi:hypothetical protein
VDVGQSDQEKGDKLPHSCCDNILADVSESEEIVPGTNLGIFPVGVIITSIWALLFLCVVGYGTWGRIQFRDQLRQRKERAAAAGKAW